MTTPRPRPPLAPVPDPEPPPAPSHDIAAEQAVIGGLLAGAPLDRAGRLDPDDFYRQAHGLILAAMRDLEWAGKPRDAVAVHDELRHRGQVGVTGGAPYLHTCLAACPSVAQVAYYSEIVAEHSIRRRLAEIGARLCQCAGWLGDASDLAERCAQVIDEIDAQARRLDPGGEW